MKGSDAAKVEGIACVAIATRDAAFAQDDVLLARRHYAFDPQQICFGVERVAAFVDDGKSGVAKSIEQRLVLAVGLTDLETRYASVFVQMHVGLVENLN